MQRYYSHTFFSQPERWLVQCWKAEYKGQMVAAKVTKCPEGFRTQEIALLRRAQGEHTVQLMAQEEQTPKGTIIVMQLCESSLQDFAKPLDPELFVGYMVQILHGLIHLHSHARIIFGDLKPDNLLVKNGRILFSDFGDGRDCDKDYSRFSGALGERDSRREEVGERKWERDSRRETVGERKWESDSDIP